MNLSSDSQFWITWLVRLGIIAFGGFLAGKGVTDEEQTELFTRIATLVVAGAMILGGLAWSYYQRSRHKEAKDTLSEIAANPNAMRVLPSDTYEHVRRVTKVTI